MLNYRLYRIKMWQKCVKRLGFDSFLSHLWHEKFLKMFYFYIKMWQKTVKTLIFVIFWIHFWNLFCQILITFCILSDICDTCVDFLSHLGDILFLTVFCHILDSYLSHFCILSHFGQFIVTYLSHFWNVGTYIKYQYRKKIS